MPGNVNFTTGYTYRIKTWLGYYTFTTALTFMEFIQLNWFNTRNHKYRLWWLQRHAHWLVYELTILYLRSKYHKWSFTIVFICDRIYFSVNARLLKRTQASAFQSWFSVVLKFKLHWLTVLYMILMGWLGCKPQTTEAGITFVTSRSIYFIMIDREIYQNNTRN